MEHSKVVEIARFKMAEGVKEEDFLKAADAMTDELKVQGGFIRRELLRDEEGRWTDIVHWQSWTDAQQAAGKVMDLPKCLNFFQMLDRNSVDMSHVALVKSYNG
jgi:quinol monooxygenase YgiN